MGLAGVPVCHRRHSRKRGWLYVISCISRPLAILPGEPRPRPVQLDEPRAWVEPVLLVGDLEGQSTPELSLSDGRYAVRFAYYRRNDLVAQRIVDALDATLRLITGPALFEPARPIGFPRALECSSSDVRHDRVIKPDCTRVVHRAHLAAYDRLRNDDQAIGDLLIGSLLQDCFLVPRGELEAAFQMLPVTVRAPYLHAVHFYRESIGDLYFSGDIIQMTLSDPNSAPTSQLERTKAEAAVWSAFKALEAIIGDPPKDERKFRSKLESHGIDPDEKVGYRPWSAPTSDRDDMWRESMSVKIRKMAACRDKRAAHGSGTTRERTISYYELMDFQACARACLVAAIRHRLGMASMGPAVRI